jgi:hypothetical protein
MGQEPLACREYGFESRRGHGCLYVASVGNSQVEVSASGWSLDQKIPTEFGVTNQRDRRVPYPESGRSTTRKILKGTPTPRYDFPCTSLWNLPDDGQKGPKHVVDDRWMQSVLTVVFAPIINADINWQTQQGDDTTRKKCCVLWWNQVPFLRIVVNRQKARMLGPENIHKKPAHVRDSTKTKYGCRF